jgi:hypothetical protein
MHSSIAAGSLFPSIMVKGLDGVEVELGKISDKADWRMVVVYRGKHCPLCTSLLYTSPSPRDATLSRMGGCWV